METVQIDYIASYGRIDLTSNYWLKNNSHKLLK